MVKELPREPSFVMANTPHDLSDLYLAPVLLAVDARLEELGKLDLGQLAYEVALPAIGLTTPRACAKAR